MITPTALAAILEVPSVRCNVGIEEVRTVRDSQRGHWSVWSRRSSCEGVRHVNAAVNRTLSDEGGGSC